MERKVTDQEEFEQTAMVHSSTLLRVALRLTGDSAHAEDVVQETLLAAWRSFHRFERLTNCKAWLFVILINQLKNYWRRQQSSPLVPVPNGRSLDSFASSTSYDWANQTLIRNAIDTLCEKQRSILLLAAVEGFSYKEISLMLSLPIGTVMSRLHRAHIHLRKQVLPPCSKNERYLMSGS